MKFNIGDTVRILRDTSKLRFRGYEEKLRRNSLTVLNLKTWDNDDKVALVTWDGTKDRWVWQQDIEPYRNDEEVIREHLSDATKYREEFQRILIELKHTAKRAV